MTVCNNVTVVSHIKNNSLFTNNGDWMCYNGNWQNYAESRVKTKQPFRNNSFLVESMRCKMFSFILLAR